MVFADWVVVILYCVVLTWSLVISSSGFRQCRCLFRRRPQAAVVDHRLSDTAGYTGGGQAFLMVFFSAASRVWLIGWVSWVIWMPLVAVIWAKMWRRLEWSRPGS